jgi:hypothetical protein
MHTALSGMGDDPASDVPSQAHETRRFNTEKRYPSSSSKRRPTMLTKSTPAKIGKLAALLGLFGLTVVIDTCSSTDQGDNAAKPAQTYYYGGPYW